MTTAHRPTFDPARGKEAALGPAYHQRLLPAHTFLKHRQPGQGGATDASTRDLRAELLEAEARHYAKKNGTYVEPDTATEATPTTKRPIEDVSLDDSEDVDEAEQKRRRVEIFEKFKDEDADNSSSESSESSDDESDDEDETVALMRELEKIKKERAEAKAKVEAEQAAQEQEQREFDIARGNPLLNPRDFTMKRRWDDDVVFKNQARGTEDKNKKKEFINDMLRSDFHKKFMSKYVR
ncbi:Cwf15/Cwc15 cell cycle control protein [Polyplosphaeria fusca]|uniref:Cwf15/Cwc15 cell cycle control protein n=1 Tax=Polyplosphaeria fusca TaxID=682080 RepID=A0A9P4V482_9PLEO|nr:Cwf15/Cwc15 cell cycle control protein [Polyplosphaeria fusca]